MNKNKSNVRKVEFSHFAHAKLGFQQQLEYMKRWLLDNEGVSVEVHPHKPAYNVASGKNMMWEIKDAPNNLIGVYFSGGMREGSPYKYTLRTLKKNSNGAEKVYVFMMKETKKIVKKNETPVETVKPVTKKKRQRPKKKVKKSWFF